MSLAGQRILIDASMVRGGGGFTHAVNLLPRLAALEPEARFRVLVSSPALGDALREAGGLDVVALPRAGLLGRLRVQFANASRLARAFGADVYFSVAESGPLAPPCPLIVCFRNSNVFTPLEQGWGVYQSLRLPALRRAAVRTSRRAARVVFVSHDSASWIGDSIGLPEAKRAVVHHGIDPARWRAAAGAAPLVRRGILSVSSVYRYKNFVRLIEAWRRLWDDRADVPDLTLVGDVVDRKHAREMEAARKACGPLAARIHIVGEVPHAEIPGWYRRASVFALPSYLETFGHPLLEAMAADLPVVAADIGASREVAGSAAEFCDPHDTASIARALGRVLGDAALRERMVAAGRERVAQFSWGAAAERTAALLAEVSDEVRRGRGRASSTG
ncbi:MAG TPA: glycosyltransferase family 1 protein [Myxococcota bacterium]|jgi:glycosyltransferase involved in cell wall biosynthesis